MLAPTAYTDVLDRWRSFDGNHSQAVASLAVALARRLGVEGDELDQIRLAALLHDIGKIAVPENILSKPGPLTDTERELVERHSLIGFELLRGMGLSPVDTYVLHHHERWDGTRLSARPGGCRDPVRLAADPRRRRLRRADLRPLVPPRYLRRGGDARAAGRERTPVRSADRRGAARACSPHPTTVVGATDAEVAWSS